MKNNILKSIVLILTLSLISVAAVWDSMELASAKLYYKQKNLPKALEYLKIEVSKNPKSEDGWLLLAQVQNELGSYYEMKDAIDAYAKLGGKKVYDLNQMKLSAWAKLFNKGVEALNNAIDNNDPNLMLAKNYFDSTCYVMPESTMNFRNRALVYYRLGEFEKAVPDFILGSNNLTDNLSVKLLGDMYLELATKSKSQFTQVNAEVFENLKNLNLIQEKLKSVDVKYYLGQPTKITKSKDKKKKTEEWFYEKYNLNLSIDKDLVSKVENNFSPKIDSTEFFNAIKYYSSAIEYLKDGMEKFPDDPKISESLMNSYIGAERNNEARTLLIERIKRNPENKYDHYNLGVFLLKENKFEEAIAEFASTIKIDSTMDVAKYNLAASYVNWGVSEQEKLKKEKKESDKSYLEKYKLALPFLVQIVTDKPNDVQMWELLGQVYANLSDTKKADEAYKKADQIREGKN